MTKINVTKLSEQEIAKRGISSWPIWEKEVSEFPWHYSSPEECLILEGEVEVTDTDTGESVRIGKGDFVRFEAGLSCRWKITSDIKKHYNFPG